MRGTWTFGCVSALSLVIGIACVDGGGPGRRDAHGDDATGSESDAWTAPVTDADDDGVPPPADCDDTNAAISPSAIEDCTTTTIDEDCDGHAGADDMDCDVDEDIDEDGDEHDDD